MFFQTRDSLSGMLTTSPSHAVLLFFMTEATLLFTTSQDYFAGLQPNIHQHPRPRPRPY